jgi:hypothetical protein
VVTGVDPEVATPEANDQYLGVSILLPRDAVSARGKVKSRRQTSDGNLVGQSDPNPIKENRTYKVEFPDGEVAELTANAIAEGMYTLCDNNGKEYLLFDCIVDHKKSDEALTNKTQSMSHNGKE